MQCASSAPGSGWSVACVSKLASLAPSRELAREFSLASGELRRRARPRPPVQCVRAPLTPGARDKKGGVGRRRVCFFGQKLCFTASIDATHTPRTAPSGTHPPALRTRPPRGSARVTRGMSPWYPSSSRETTRKSFGGAGGVGARRRLTPAHQQWWANRGGRWKCRDVGLT